MQDINLQFLEYNPNKLLQSELEYISLKLWEKKVRIVIKSPICFSEGIFIPLLKQTKTEPEMFVKEVSSAHQGFIHLIKNRVKSDILWNIITI